MPKPPKTLYHYCSVAAAHSILSTRKIRLSPLANANDMLEGRLIASELATRLAKSQVSNGLGDFARFTASTYADHTDGFAFCMSEQGDLLSQWRAYGFDGEGFSIGFDYSELVKDFGEVNFGSKFFEISPVDYGVEKTCDLLDSVTTELERIDKKFGDTVRLNSKYSIESAITGVKGMYENIPSLFLFSGTQEHNSAFMKEALSALQELHFKIYFFKDAGFQEEREWRALRYRHRDNHPEITYIAHQNGIRPTIECFIADPAKKVISEVLIGPKNRTDETWMVAYLARVGLGHVRVGRSSVKGYR